MREIISGARIFYVENEPVRVLDGNNRHVMLYPYGQEILFIQKGIKPSDVIRHIESEGRNIYLTLSPRFKISESTEFYETYRKHPGLLIRYSDSADIRVSPIIPQPESRIIEDCISYADGFDRDYEEYKRNRRLNNVETFNPLDLDPIAHIAFNSRNVLLIHKDALLEHPDESDLEREVKRLFREFLIREKGIVFEALVHKEPSPELVFYSPDLVLLENALRNGVEVRISHYKFTNLAITGFVYHRLMQSNETIRQQLHEKSRGYWGILGELGIDFKGAAMELLENQEQILRICDLVDEIRQAYKRLQE